jgi:polygalacturonase
VRIDTPADARNTDGIDPGASQDITIAHAFIRTGDDNIAIKAGKGPTRHVSVLDSHFYAGHGMSIGSETQAGVSDILVRHLTPRRHDLGVADQERRQPGAGHAGPL